MIIKSFKTEEDIEIKTPKELKIFLSFCNPTVLKYYKKQIAIVKPDIKIDGIGTAIKLYKKEIENV